MERVTASGMAWRIIAEHDMIVCESILCVVEPIDMRRGADGLSTWIQVQLGQAPAAGTGFIFTNKPRTRLKLNDMDSPHLQTPSQCAKMLGA